MASPTGSTSKVNVNSVVVTVPELPLAVRPLKLTETGALLLETTLLEIALLEASWPLLAALLEVALLDTALPLESASLLDAALPEMVLLDIALPLESASLLDASELLLDVTITASSSPQATSVNATSKTNNTPTILIFICSLIYFVFPMPQASQTAVENFYAQIPQAGRYYWSHIAPWGQAYLAVYFTQNITV